ncbi:hypothetical protein KBY22_06005 [Ruegeria pomeroyi]|uniref:Uncharacterized protein n=2 Tax=Ruegeria TaxID=97050 RepID=A0A9Q3WMH1_9RHOB|nr:MULTISPECIES: hypothetical protein [Ruegeria]MCE8508716.1 hypothetical protein [Ruegeria pomeroyi]MCE8512238.1 hypothetical protein [Ruegeria pomeroyi]MCE8515263.1 hypothetical protein [Ruegeria pomeroyi]MCE8524640.1 hypothetical protein [Ruegeria pomeroyi]MCE8528820.1 hypothetical protein [Ruegeria pomeroyi]
MTWRRTGWTLVTAALLLPGMAMGFQAFNRFEVYPVSKGVFEVVNRHGSAPKDFWCGAGDYAIRVLRTSATQRIYLWQAVGPAVTVKGRKGVQFSLQPPQGADTNPGYSISVKKVGDNMTASMAQNYCYDRLTDDFWLRP